MGEREREGEIEEDGGETVITEGGRMRGRGREREQKRTVKERNGQMCGWA